MFYFHEVRNYCVPAIFERRSGRLGSKISGCGQLAEVAGWGTTRSHVNRLPLRNRVAQ